MENKNRVFCTYISIISYTENPGEGVAQIFTKILRGSMRDPMSMIRSKFGFKIFKQGHLQYTLFAQSNLCTQKQLLGHQKYGVYFSVIMANVIMANVIPADSDGTSKARFVKYYQRSL
jgi:hypothetical protein